MTEVATLERRYGALRTIAGFYKVVAILVLVVLVISALVVFLRSASLMSRYGQPSAGKFLAPLTLTALVPAGGTFITGLLIFLALYAGGEAIHVVIHIEENTRATRRLLE